MLEKAELTLISMLSKTKKVITTHPPVLCSVASCKLFYSTVERVGTLSLLFVPPAKGGGMEISMRKAHMSRVSKGKCDASLTAPFNSILYSIDRMGNSCVNIADTVQGQLELNSFQA